MRQEGINTTVLEDSVARLMADAVLVRTEAPETAWGEVLELVPGVVLLPRLLALHADSSDTVGVDDLSAAELETLVVLAQDPGTSLQEAKESARALEE